MTSYDEVPTQLAKAQRFHARLGYPKVDDQLIADLSDWCEIPVARIVTFVRYGNISEVGNY